MYDYSGHRNDNAQKNRVTDNRPLSTREREDDAQMSYLSQWQKGHPSGDNFWLVVFLTVTVLALGLYIDHRRNIAVSVKATVSNRDVCTVCHFPEVVVYKTLHEYKVGLKLKRKAAAKVLPVDMNLLAELMEAK